MSDEDSCWLRADFRLSTIHTRDHGSRHPRASDVIVPDFLTTSPSVPISHYRDVFGNWWPVDRLIPYAKNARTHSDAQIAAIAASIKEWGWTTPALVGEDGGLIAGHARILPAR